MAAALASAMVDPAMYGLPPGTRIPPDVQQAMILAQQGGGLHPGMPVVDLNKAAANAGAELMGEIGKMAKGFGDLAGFDGSAPARAPRIRVRKEEEEEESWMTKTAGNMVTSGLNSSINAGLDMVGAG
ncbi:unnamed protein product [Scytosiphon promiscuus]